MKRLSIWFGMVATIASSGVAAQSKSEGLVIEITRGLPQVKTSINSKTESIQASPVSDGGELLRSINGVSGTRMGGRSIDPLIRGQKQTQLNVLLDGAYLHGGCPNRMDPPTSYTAVDSYDSVKVIKGNRTVIYGGGGSGGTVLFQREWPQLGENNYKGELSSSFKGNGNRKELGADLAAGSDQGYVRVIGHKSDADNYKDGNGDEVRSSYKSETGALLAGLAIGDSTWLEGSFEKSSEKDLLFPGSGMDSPYANATNTRLRLTHSFSGDVLRKLKVEAYKTDVKHMMDNYSLRTPGMMQMGAPSTSDTEGFRLIADLSFADIQWQVGADMQNNTRDASAINKMNNKIVGTQWPDARIRQTGLFAEGEKSLGVNDTVKAGLRHDYVTAEARRRNEAIQAGGLMGKTPEQVWGGKSGKETTENNTAGFGSWTHRINEQYSTELTLSRSVRSADATERYMAMGHWRGNPDLDPERHNQLELTLQSKQQDLSWSATAWYNKVQDYILRNNTGSFDTYRNVDAHLYGAELEASYRIASNWMLSSQLAWIEGKNSSDNKNLSQISPVTLTTSLDYTRENWRAGVEWQLAERQNNVCLNSSECGGQDVQKTPGHGVVNFYSEYKVSESLTLIAGVDNLFDKAYQMHESRNDAFNPKPVQVFEPGRNVWVRATASF